MPTIRFSIVCAQRSLVVSQYYETVQFASVSVILT